MKLALRFACAGMTDERRGCLPEVFDEHKYEISRDAAYYFVGKIAYRGLAGLIMNAKQGGGQ